MSLDLLAACDCFRAIAGERRKGRPLPLRRSFLHRKFWWPQLLTYEDVRAQHANEFPSLR